MSYLVLAYPEINKTDYEWIQDLRRKYDQTFYNVVEPHFTIVFPVFKLDESVFRDHIVNLSKDVSPIKFSTRRSMVVKDSLSDSFDLFLVPDEGNSGIMKLHDRLYTEILLPELRLDVPFIPHIAIGSSKDPRECKKYCDLVNKENFCIDGVINTLDIVWYDYPEVRRIEKIRLGY
jgi:2'-5' RNA ligase